eukprot:scaffold251839_cov31-Prasinocladus_malaysianus.AAC.1
MFSAVSLEMETITMPPKLSVFHKMQAMTSISTELTFSMETYKMGWNGPKENEMVGNIPTWNE